LIMPLFVFSRKERIRRGNLSQSPCPDSLFNLR
jgi:hypothetical protein